MGAERQLSAIVVPLLLAIVPLLFSVQKATAATLAQPWNFERSISEASLILEGKVVSIKFRNSEPLAKDGPTLPHTFVTYEVENVLRGRSSSQSITLRFLGGWSSETGRIMMVPHAPMFKPGDHDILFVAANGAAACPLISCNLGRFRIWQNTVYSDTGLAIRADADDQLRFGPEEIPRGEIRMEFPPAPPQRLRALRQKLETDTTLDANERRTLLRRLSAMSSVRTITPGREVSNRGVKVPSMPPIDVADFRAKIARISAKHPATGPPVASVSADKPFRFPKQKLRAAEPPSRVPQPSGAALTREQQLLRRNNGNPVIRDQ